MIVTVITHGSEMWITDSDIKSSVCYTFEKIQNHIIKTILGIHRKASVLEVNVEIISSSLYYLWNEKSLNTILD